MPFQTDSVAAISVVQTLHEGEWKEGAMGSSSKGLRVLLAGLKGHRLQTLGERIENDGHRVTTAPGDASAAILARMEKFDAVVADVDNLGTEGIETLEDLSRLQSKATVLALVPPGEEQALSEAFDSGADYCAEKPVGTDEILGFVKLVA